MRKKIFDFVVDIFFSRKWFSSFSDAERNRWISNLNKFEYFLEKLFKFLIECIFPSFFCFLFNVEEAYCSSKVTAILTLTFKWEHFYFVTAMILVWECTHDWYEKNSCLPAYYLAQRFVINWRNIQKLSF